MSFALKTVVPWGRSFDEYVAMFDLSAADLQSSILGCGDGPAAFNAALSACGGNITSVDPIYGFSAAEIQTRINETFEVVMEQARANQHEFIWEHIRSPEELGKIRMEAMAQFLKDFPAGKADGRYIEGALPWLPFVDRRFDLALCSHFLFLYSEQFSADFHVQSILELCRVAREVRIFPLLELGSKPSRHFSEVTQQLQANNLAISVRPVPYVFQRGGSQMMTVQSFRNEQD